MPLTEITWNPEDYGPEATGPGSNTTGAMLVQTAPAGPGVLEVQVGSGGGPGAATQLVIAVQPSNAVSLAPMAPSIVVEAQDALGNVDTSWTGTVVLDIDNDPNTILAASVVGTPSVAAIAGVATFANIAVNLPESGYTLVASDQAAILTPATSDAFDITGDETEFYYQPSVSPSYLYGMTFNGHATRAGEVQDGSLLVFTLPDNIYTRVPGTPNSTIRSYDSDFSLIDSSTLIDPDKGTSCHYSGSGGGAILGGTTENGVADSYATYDPDFTDASDIAPGNTINSLAASDLRYPQGIGNVLFEPLQSGTDEMAALDCITGAVNFNAVPSVINANLALQADTETGGFMPIFTVNDTHVFVMRAASASNDIVVDRYLATNGTFVDSHTVFSPAIAGDYTGSGMAANASTLAVLFESGGDNYFLSITLAGWTITDNSDNFNAETGGALPVTNPQLRDKAF